MAESSSSSSASSSKDQKDYYQNSKEGSGKSRSDSDSDDDDDILDSDEDSDADVDMIHLDSVENSTSEKDLPLNDNEKVPQEPTKTTSDAISPGPGPKTKRQKINNTAGPGLSSNIDNQKFLEGEHNSPSNIIVKEIKKDLFNVTKASHDSESDGQVEALSDGQTQTHWTQVSNKSQNQKSNRKSHNDSQRLSQVSQTNSNLNLSQISIMDIDNPESLVGSDSDSLVQPQAQSQARIDKTLNELDEMYTKARQHVEEELKKDIVENAESIAESSGTSELFEKSKKILSDYIADYKTE